MHVQAGPGRRLAAFAIDYGLISGYAILLAIISVSISPPATTLASPPNSSPWMFDLLALLTLVLPVTLYFGLTEASSQRATLGKRRMRLAVVDRAGRRLRVGRSLLRAAVKFLPWQIAHTSLFHIPGWPTAVETMPPGAIIGLVSSLTLAAIYAIGLFLPGRRTLYDMVSGSRVIHR